MKRTKLLVLAVIILVVLGLGGLLYALSRTAKPAGISSINAVDLSGYVTQPKVTGTLYALSDDFAITSTMRFSASTVPSGWHVVEDSGSGKETAIYNLESDDKKTKINTLNLATNLSTYYSSLSKCTEAAAERYTSEMFLTQYYGAVAGSVVASPATTHVIASMNGDGVTMSRVDYSYKDKNGVTQYATRLFRCGSTNALTILVSGTDQEKVLGTVNATLKQVMLKP